MPEPSCEQLRQELTAVKSILAEFALAINEPLSDKSIKILQSLKTKIQKAIPKLDNLWFDSEPILNKIIDIVIKTADSSPSNKEEVEQLIKDWTKNNLRIDQKNRKIIITGDWDLSGSTIGELPDNIQIEGNLHLEHSSISKLPNNLYVEGWLYVDKSLKKEAERLAKLVNLKEGVATRE